MREKLRSILWGFLYHFKRETYPDEELIEKMVKEILNLLKK